MDKIKEIIDRTKKHCSEKQAEAKKMTNGKVPSDEKNFPYKKDFDKLPSTGVELLAYMNELQGQIDCMGEGNEAIIQEYESRKVKINELQNTIANFDQNNTEFERQMEEIHDKWYSEIMETIDIINSNFSKFMSAMNLAGEVELIRNNEVSSI